MRVLPMHPLRLARPLALGLALLPWGCGTSTSTDTSPPVTTCPAIVTDTLEAPAEPPDGPAACAAGDCNYQTQEGCDADQACRPQFNATDPEVHPGCEPAGTGESGDECSA